MGNGSSPIHPFERLLLTSIREISPKIGQLCVQRVAAPNPKGCGRSGAAGIFPLEFIWKSHSTLSTKLVSHLPRNFTYRHGSVIFRQPRMSSHYSCPLLIADWVFCKPETRWNLHSMLSFGRSTLWFIWWTAHHKGASAWRGRAPAKQHLNAFAPQLHETLLAGKRSDKVALPRNGRKHGNRMTRHVLGMAEYSQSASFVESHRAFSFFWLRDLFTRTT